MFSFDMSCQLDLLKSAEKTWSFWMLIFLQKRKYSDSLKYLE